MTSRKLGISLPERKIEMNKRIENYSDEELQPFVSEWFSRQRRNRTHQPRAKVKRPCPLCKRMFGARELKEHKPHCPKKAAAA